MARGSASGKIILFGEHAVVYGRPALAVPLSDLRARVRVEPRTDSRLVIHATDLGRTFALDQAAAADPLAAITRAALAELRAPEQAGLDLWIESEIPLASGLGSGAAVSTALVRALAAQFGQSPTPEKISALVYETEKLYHGTPSGIDNTVIALELPIRFVKGQGAQPFRLAHPFALALASTGIASPTRITVGAVRRGWEAEPARYNKIFDEIGALVEHAQDALARGETERLGALMNQNQGLLRALDVSSDAIENLLRAGLNAGASGGKLSGGGRGGTVIFHVEPDRAPGVQEALLEAGAATVRITTVAPAPPASEVEKEKA